MQAGTRGQKEIREKEQESGEALIRIEGIISAQKLLAGRT
jgi:hypothetical protein